MKLKNPLLSELSSHNPECGCCAPGAVRKPRIRERSVCDKDIEADPEKGI